MNCELLHEPGPLMSGIYVREPDTEKAPELYVTPAVSELQYQQVRGVCLGSYCTTHSVCGYAVHTMFVGAHKLGCSSRCSKDTWLRGQGAEKQSTGSRSTEHARSAEVYCTCPATAAVAVCVVA